MADTAAPPTLRPGTRVRIAPQPIALALTRDTGTVMRSDPEYLGYYIIRLDEPATYHNVDGRTEPVGELLECWDNIDVLEPARQPAALRAPLHILTTFVHRVERKYRG